MILPATVSIPCFDGSPPVGEHSLTKYTTVVDRKFIPHMPAVLLQIKFKSKGHWTCWLSIPCVQMTLERVKPQPPPLVPNPQSQPSYFSPLFLCLWSYSMWEVRNDTWRFMVAYHFCIDQISLFFYKYIWSLQHVADVRWYRTYVLVAYHFCIDHWTSSPLFGTIIYRIYYNII